MPKPITIISATISNFMGIKVLRLDNLGKVIQLTGPNGAGKSSAMAAAKALLLGKRSAPSKPVRAGAKRSRVEFTLSDGGVLTEVHGTKGQHHLEVVAKDGKVLSSPRERIKRLIGGGLAIEPLKLMAMSPAEKRAQILQLIGVDLESFAKHHDEAYEERRLVNRDLARVRAAIGDPVEAPDDEVSLADLSKELSAAKDEAAENERRRAEARAGRQDETACRTSVTRAEGRAAELKEQLAEAVAQRDTLRIRHKESERQSVALNVAAGKLKDPDTAPILRQIEEAEKTNIAVRAKKAHVEGAMNARALESQSNAFTRQIEGIEEEKLKALAGAKMPVKGLTVDDEGLHLDGVPLEQVETSRVIQVCVQIAAAMKPQLSVAFVENGNDLTPETFEAFTASCAEVDIDQVWIERLTPVGDEGVIRIEAGEVAGE